MEKRSNNKIFPISVKYLMAGLAVLAVPFFWGTTCHGQKTALEYFDEAWTMFDENYSYFTYKEINWDAVKTTWRPQFAQDMDGDDFSQKFNEVLNILHDWHVWVKNPSGEYLGFYEAYETNYPETLFTSYTGDVNYQKLGENVIYHALVDGSIAHIVIDSLSSSSFATITDEDIAALFTRYADTDGMIIDIRANNGGDESNAVKFASRFTDQDTIYGYVKYRTPGQDHNAFENLISKTLIPDGDFYYDRPVACLIGKRCMSSAEWFTLMMKNCPNVTLIGDTTRGASANPQQFDLDNGVAFGISSWVAYTDQMEPIEDRGITPDISIAAASSYDAQRDYVLEKAIEVIQEETVSVVVLTSTSQPVTTINPGHLVMVYGTRGINEIIVQSGAKAELINFPGDNIITINSDSHLFTVYRSGATVIFEGTNGTFLKIPATTDSQIIYFTDGFAVLSIDADSKKVILLGNGNQIINTVFAQVNSSLLFSPGLYGLGTPK